MLAQPNKTLQFIGITPAKIPFDGLGGDYAMFKLLHNCQGRAPTDLLRRIMDAGDESDQTMFLNALKYGRGSPRKPLVSGQITPLRDA